MANKYFSDVAPSKQTGGGGGSNKAMGSAPKVSMPMRTAAWPGLPGKSGPDRSGGTPKQGKLGPFYVISQMSPKKMAAGYGKMKTDMPPESEMMMPMPKKMRMSKKGM